MGTVDRLVPDGRQHANGRDVDDAPDAGPPGGLEHVALSWPVRLERSVGVSVQGGHLHVARRVDHRLRLQACKHIDQLRQILDGCDLGHESALVLAEHVSHLDRRRPAAGQDRDTPFLVEKSASDVAADEPEPAGDEHQAAGHQPVRPAFSTERAVNSSLIRTSMHAARSAPSMAARFSRPDAMAITSGTPFNCSHSTAISRSSSTWTGSPSELKKRVDMSPTAPCAKSRWRSRGEMW